MAIAQADALTTASIAAHFGVPRWKITRLFERNLLPPPTRCGTFRILPSSALPEVERALRKAGYLPAADGAGAVPA